MTCIKLLIALTGLALLTACGGGSPTVNIGEININTGNTCTTEPFGDDCGNDYDAARVKRIEECLIGKAASTPTCELATAEYSCIDNPFTEACATNEDFKDYIKDARDMRTTYCQANPDETAFCAEFVKFNNICSGNTDVFNLQCFIDSAGRNQACIANGIGAGGHATCAGILVTPCTTDPFTNSHCDDATGISGIRNNYCGMAANAWGDDCVVATYPSTADGRDMACLQYGIDANAGGNALCAMRPNVTEACDVESPFAYPVCDEVANIDRLRTTFCQIAANSFTTGCEQTTHGDVDTARDSACLMDLPTATGCNARPNVGTTCTDNPLPSVNPGCAKLPNYGMLLSVFCTMEGNSDLGGCGTDATNVCPNDAFNPSAGLNSMIDCLGDPTYAPARLTACSTETETNRCDTTIIAPVVCADSGASANPFAAFCTSATNTGGGNIAQIRQAVLTSCFDNTKNTDGDICQNTAVTRGELTADCILGGAFQTKCAYTEYEPQKIFYCNDQANTWDMLCDGDIVNTTPAMRDAACLADADADMGYTGSDTRCGARDAVILACPAGDPFAHAGCDNVANIDAGFRTTYCALTINAFKTKCKTDGTHGEVLAARGKACVEFGTDTMTGGHASCVGNTLAESSCKMNPFDDTKPGCAILTEFPMIVENFCRMNQSNSNCTVKTSAWVENARNADDTAGLEVRGVRAALANDEQYTLITGGTESLELGDAVAKHADNFGDLTFKNTLLPVGSAFIGETAFTGNPNVAGGISYATNVGATKLYAGLLSDTDVGAPLEATPTANWLGRLGFIRGENITTNAFHAVADFQLVIDFTNTTLSQTVALSNRETTFYEQFIIAGKFNDKGVIFGTATYELRRTSNNDLNSSGTGLLTGLIGQKGAAAVFHRTAGSINFIGGFVAAPYVPAEDDDASKVTFNDWVRGFDYPLPTSSAVEIARTTSKPHFIRPKTDGTLDLTGVTGTTQHKATRAGDDKDGFAYGVGKIVTASTPAGISHNFVGILPSTDLGAPLTEAIAIAKWLGQFSFGNSATLNDIEFTLTFDGTNSGTIDGMFGFVRFDLVFDGKGIVTGDVTYSPSGTNPTTTVARGLIGEEGLVGVFTNINNGNTTGIEFGGFVAQPGPPPIANYDAWLGDFERTLSTALSTAGATRRERTRQFLAGRDDETTLDDSLAIRPLAHFGLTFNSAMYEGKTLSGNSDFRDGFAGFTDVVDVQISNANIPTHVIYYAGLLTGTDLGAPLTDTIGSATLFGQIQIARFGAIDTNPAEDFKLKVVFGGSGDEAGSIEGFVQSLNAAGKGYRLTGTYDTGGLITGRVTFATFTGSLDGGNLATQTTPNGILTGLIGKHGAVGVFLAGGGTKEAITGGSSDQNAYVGGFVATFDSCAAANNCTVNRDVWSKSFEPALSTALTATIPATNRKRQFLAGEVAGLDDTNTINATPYNLTLASAMYNGAALTTAGDKNDGYGLLVDTVATNNYVYYAGILAGTDLGAPLIQSSGKFDWHGQIQIIRGGSLVTSTTEDFTLHITLGAVSGMDGSAGSISGFFGRVVAGSSSSNNITHEYRLAGTYYTDGVIDGTVSYSTFVGNNAPTNSPGFLTGLMGAKGAVGVFISGAGTKESITNAVGATTATTYAGGFVVSGAAPPPVYVPPGDNDTDKVTFSDWERDFGEHRPPLTLRATNPPADRQRQFLRGGTTGLLATTGKVVATPTSVTANLGVGNTNDGYHYFIDRVATNIRVPYAGLLSGTDLGAPVTSSTFGPTQTAVWNGTLRAHTNLTVNVDKPLALTITFGADDDVEGSVGSIAGAVRTFTTTGFELKGTYDASGVISGTVYHGAGFPSTGDVVRTATNTNGILTGLIGAQGAVGVFLSGTGTKEDITVGVGSNYVGGFVAAPILSIPNYDTFVRHYEPQKNADNTKLLESGIAAGRLNQFLKGQETGITFPLSVEVALDYTATGHFETVALKLEGDSANGIGLMRAFVSVDQINELHRSGILLGTDLGAPLTGNEMGADWSGKLYVTRHVNASDENKPIAIDLTLAVDFSAGTIRTANAVTTAPNETVAINGTFGAGDITLPAGIMGGTVSYHDGTTTYHALPLIGLIGEDGAIGVFHGGEGVLLPMAGGFVVKP